MDSKVELSPIARSCVVGKSTATRLPAPRRSLPRRSARPRRSRPGPPRWASPARSNPGVQRLRHQRVRPAATVVVPAHDLPRLVVKRDRRIGRRRLGPIVRSIGTSSENSTYRASLRRICTNCRIGSKPGESVPEAIRSAPRSGRRRLSSARLRSWEEEGRRQEPRQAANGSDMHLSYPGKGAGSVAEVTELCKQSHHIRCTPTRLLARAPDWLYFLTNPPESRSMDMPVPDPLILARKARIVDRLRAVLPEDAVIQTRPKLRAYECDALTAYRCPPLAAVLPRIDRGGRRRAARLPRGRRAGRAARVGHQPRRRRAADGGLRDPRRRADERGARDGLRQPLHPGAVGAHQPFRLRRGRGTRGSSMPPTRPASSPAPSPATSR